MPKNEQIVYPIIVRTSAIVLFFRLTLLELLSAVSKIIVLFPGMFAFDYLLSLFADSQNMLYLLSIFIYIFITLWKMAFSFFVVYQWLQRHYRIREDEIIIEEGVMSLKQKRFDIKNIESLSIRQGLIGKLFNYGTIELFDPRSRISYYLYNIPQPKTYVAIIESLIKNKPVLPADGEIIFPAQR